MPIYDCTDQIKDLKIGVKVPLITLMFTYCSYAAYSQNLLQNSYLKPTLKILAATGWMKIGAAVY